MKNKLLLALSFCTTISFAQIDLPVDFELGNTEYFTDFAGNESMVVADPTNPSNSVALSSKTVSAETYAGTTLGENGFSSPIPFTMAETTISLRVYSAYPGTPIHLKAEDAIDPGIFVETRMYTTKSNEWETIVFDFAEHIFGSPPLNINTDYEKLSVFFNFGTLGAAVGQRDYYWDDVMMGGVSTTLDQLDLPVTFELSGISYALVDFENNSSTIGPDPLDPSNTVAITTKPVNTSAWSGTIVGTRNGFENVIPFSSSDAKIKMRVYSPDINTPILLKAETVSDPNLFVQTLQYTTTANEWEDMEWNFLQHMPGTPAIDFNLDYSLLAVFFNFGIEGSAVGEKTYYWDDVTMDVVSSVETIDNLAVSVFPNPVSDFLQINVDGEITEINIFNMLGQLVKRELVSPGQTIFDVAQLTQGTYIVRVKTDEKEGSILVIKD